jgi:integrase
MSSIIQPRKQGFRPWGKKLTNRVWISRLKFYFELAGLPSGYTGHAFRAGGATDLFLAGLNLQEVQKFGRWKSLVVLIYYREEIQWVSCKASSAFAVRYAGYFKKLIGRDNKLK